jgi:hypothetical protein
VTVKACSCSVDDWKRQRTGGSAFTVRVGLNTAGQNVYAEDITLNYDPAVFEFDSAIKASDDIISSEVKLMIPAH